MYPVYVARVSQPFADPGSYASRADAHGPAGHHTGMDFGSRWPVPINKALVRSVLGGEVVISEYNSTMGNWVGVYNHEHNMLVTYWHLSERRVSVGDWVVPYAALGKVGSTGNSSAPHLHVQVNWGRAFDYHGHIHPVLAFNMAPSRKEARKAFRRSPVHPRARS